MHKRGGLLLIKWNWFGISRESLLGGKLTRAGVCGEDFGQAVVGHFGGAGAGGERVGLR